MEAGRIRSRLAPPQPLAGADESRRKERAERDPHAGPDPALLDRIAHHEDAAERERESADPDHPAGTEPLLETGPLRRRCGGRMRYGWGWRGGGGGGGGGGSSTAGSPSRAGCARAGGVSATTARRSDRRCEWRLTAPHAFQPVEARFQRSDACGERRSRRWLVCNPGFENAYAPAQADAHNGADDTGNRYEQDRDNHEDPEQLFQGRDPRSKMSAPLESPVPRPPMIAQLAAHARSAARAGLRSRMYFVRGRGS